MKKILVFFLFLGIGMRLQSQTIVPIETNHFSIIYKVENGKLKQVYLGPRIKELAAIRTPQFDAFSTSGGSDVNETALQVVHADGNTSTELQYVSHVSQTLSEQITLTKISLKDSYFNFFVDLYFKACKNEDVIETWTEFNHTENKAVTLYNFASSQLSFKASNYWLTHFHGDWANEGNLDEAELTAGIKVVDSKLGVRATQRDIPSFLVSLNGKSDEDRGEVIGASLAWPGSFRLCFEINQNNDLRVISGINPYSSVYKLEPNKSFTTPSLILTYSSEGKGLVSRNFHRWARKYGLRDGDKGRLTLLNNWEATYFNFDEQKLSAIIADASKIGLDLFLLDDGWFGNKYPRDNDNAGLGDWDVNTRKLPHGIDFLVKESQKNGIKFGIWVEPEMINPKSELFEKHPEWVITQPNRKLDLSRNQLILDLSNPKVQDYVVSIVNDLLKANPGIAYIKWDCNRFITNGGSSYLSPQNQSHLQIDYARGIISVYDRVMKANPNVEFMLCSGGGGRQEYGSLKYFHEYWPSDNTDALQRIFIQWGGSFFFPAISSCNHVSVVPNHQTGRVTPLKFRFDVAMTGKLGMDLQPQTMSADDLAFTKSAIATYKQIQDVIWYGDLYRLVSPYDQHYSSVMYVNEKQSRAIVFGYLLKRQLGDNFPPIKLKGLNPLKNYQINEINLKPGAKSRFWDNGKVVSGEALMNQGLLIPLRQEYESIVLEIIEK